MPEKTITITSPENYSNWNYYKTETIDFSGKASMRKNVSVEKVSETGLGSSIATVNYHIQGTNGFNSGDGETLIDYVSLEINIKTVKQNTYVGTYSNPTSSYIAVQGSITIKVTWEDYTPTAVATDTATTTKTETKTETQLINDGVISTPPARSQTVSSSVSAVYWTNYPVSPQNETEWVEQRRILDTGINIKCIDLTHKERHGFGEIRAEENIVNNLIKDENTAKRIGKSAIFDSAKSLEISLSIPPNFAIKPRSFITTKISSLFLEITEQVKSREFFVGSDNQEYKINFSCKNEPYNREGKILLLNTATKQLEEYNFEFVLQKVRTEYTYPGSGFIYTDGNYCFWNRAYSSLCVNLRTGEATTITMPNTEIRMGCCFDGNFYDGESGKVKKISPAGAVSTFFSYGGVYFCMDANSEKVYTVYKPDGNVYLKEFDDEGTVYNTVLLQAWPDNILVHSAVDDTYLYLIDPSISTVYIYSLEDFSLVDSFVNTDLGSENSYDGIDFKVFNSKIFAVRTNYGTTRKLVIDIDTGETEINKVSGNYTNIQII